MKLKIRWRSVYLKALIGIGLSCSTTSIAISQETTREGDWLTRHDVASNTHVHSMELTLTPQLEPRPALRYKLTPDDYELQDGNSAVFYLKAMGFLEQNSARDKLSETFKKANQTAQEQGIENSKVPPWSWQDTAPKDLPQEEVEQYLNLTRFQTSFLEKATQRRSFSLDRNMHLEKDPIGYLLPEIQYMRELARTQRLRCRLAIAQGKIDEAIAILSQQYTLAKHLGTDEFLVSNLVGAAIASMSTTDTLQLIQHPKAPNLYWALASLPNPLIDMRSSLAYERQFLFEQIKLMKEVDEQPRNAGYWQDFVDRLIPQIESLDSSIGLNQITDPELKRAAFVAALASAYPGAKQYLIEDLHMDVQLVESYTTTQTVLLAAKKFYEEVRDDYFKWSNIPYAQASANQEFQNLDATLRDRTKRVGWGPAGPANLLLPAVNSVKTAQARSQQSIALLQTVEAIRLYGAKHDGKLPPSLETLDVPAPVDPITGKLLSYSPNGDSAVLTGARTSGIQYQLVLRFAKPN